MTSKHQKRLFPLEKLGKFLGHLFEKNEVMIEVNHKDLKLIVQNNQLCWYHEDTDTLLPIARKSTITKLFNTEN